MPLPISNILVGLAALAAVLCLIVLSGRLARNVVARRPQAGRRLAIRESIALDPRRRLIVITCDGRDAALLTGGPTDVFLGWLSGTENPS